MRVSTQEEGTSWRWLEQKAACQHGHLTSHSNTCAYSLPEADGGEGLRAGLPLLCTCGFWRICKLPPTIHSLRLLMRGPFEMGMIPRLPAGVRDLQCP